MADGKAAEATGGLGGDIAEMLMAAPVRVWLIGPDGAVLWCNRQAAALFGRAPETLVGAPRAGGRDRPPAPHRAGGREARRIWLGAGGRQP